MNTRFKEPTHKATRQTNIELMRIISMILIIGCHFATHGGFQFDSSKITIPQIWWHVLELGGGFGTDLFIMISGYFLIEDKVIPAKHTKIILFWLQTFFYSFALFIISIIFRKECFSIVSLAKTFLPISFSSWWFASVYFLIYVLHPYINLGLNSMTAKQYRWFLSILIILWSIIPTFTTSQLYSNQLIELLLMYCIAGYIRKFGLFVNVKSKQWLSLWLLFSLITLLSSILLLLLGRKWSLAATHSTYFYSRTSFLTIARAVCFFMAFLKMKIQNITLINRFSSATFGVYLLHDSALLRNWLWIDLLKNASYANKLSIIPYSIICTLAIFAVGVVIDLLRQQLIEKPIVNLLFRFGSHRKHS